MTSEGPSQELPPLPADLQDDLLAALFGDPAQRDATIAGLMARSPGHAPAIHVHVRHHRGLLGEAALAFADGVPGYRLLDVLGEGGMGTVYRAEQLVPIRRMVALKVIKPGMDSKAVVERFVAERQALAAMDHDAIAKVFDCGTTVRGQPFFAMEFVAGLPIQEYCDARRLSLRDRIALFRQVCSGVQHAHQKGVIHRDLKPRNILVAEQGGQHAVKIIDFGVARATDRQFVDRTLCTEQGLVLGTPEYMSPEQAAGDPGRIDTRSDVYSLGVVLYELLVGELPFPGSELRAAGVAEIQRRLREEDPPRPSARLATQVGPAQAAAALARQTTVATLQRTLRHDLDWVVLAAMEKEPGRRYASAEALSADLLRYLQHEPVLAGPPTVGYRMRKFARRYRAQVSAACLLFLALTAGLVGTIWQRNQAVAAREAATRRTTDLYDLVNNAFVGMRRRVMDMPGSLPVQQYLAEQIAKLVENLGEEADADWQARYLMAMSYAALGDLHGLPTGSNLGEPERAEQEYGRALDLMTGLAADPQAVAGEGGWRPVLRDLSVLHERLGQLLAARGRPDAALAHLQDALRWTEQAVAQSPDMPSRFLDLGSGHDALAEFLRRQGDTEPALAASTRAQQCFRDGLRAQPDEPVLQHSLACSLEKRALLLDAAGEPQQAHACLVESLEIHRAALAKDAHHTPSACGFVSVACNLAETELLAGHGAAAEEMLREAEPIAARLRAADPGDVRAVEIHGRVARYRGWALLDTRRAAEAIPVLDGAMRGIESLAPAVRTMELRQQWTFLGELLGMARRSLGQLDDAIALEREILARREGFVDELPTAQNAHFLLVAFQNLRASLDQSGRQDEVSGLDERRLLVVDRFVTQHAADTSLQDDLLRSLVEAGQSRLRLQKDPAAAGVAWRRALGVVEQLLEQRGDVPELTARFEWLREQLQRLGGR